MKNFLLIMLLSFFSAAYSQINLVKNPSFEQFDTCVNDQNQIHYATGWSSAGLSPDYFNACSSNPSFSVPNNWGGYQQAATGNAYCALGTYFSPILNGRELIIGQLDSPLTIGTKYRASFKASLSISDEIFANCATNRLGILFSTISYNASNSPPIANFSHVYSDNVIADTNNWTLISDTFFADSAYKYLIFGNFFNDANTDTVILKNDSSKFAYYFIDDVSVSQYTTGIIENGINKNYFSYTLSNGLLILNLNDDLRIDKNELKIYNLLGEEVFNQAIYGKATSLNLNNIPYGFYILNIRIENIFFTRKFIKT